MSEQYEPELGQMLFGQESQEYDCPEHLKNVLAILSDELEKTLERNPYGQTGNPFDNTGGSFRCDTFVAEAYSWNEEYDQPFNFKYKDVEVSWYKYLGRGMSVNREVPARESAQLLTECLAAIEGGTGRQA